MMSVVGILIALGLLVWLAYRGWSILLLAPFCALIAALLAGEPLLANWTQTFMRSAADFVAHFFPIFLLGALFGKLKRIPADLNRWDSQGLIDERVFVH
jgi:H+/gluconate symporter-like permease